VAAPVRSVTRALVLLTAAAVLGAACGRTSPLTKAQYERQVSQIVKQLSTTLDSTFASPKLQNPSSLKEAGDILARGGKSMEESAGRLDRLNPPEQITSIHKQLVEGIRDFAAAFGNFAQSTAKGDLPAIQRFGQQVSDQTLPAMVEIQHALDALKAKGFDISRG
jgi:hypothetical protein